MKKDFFFLLLILFLIKTASSPLPQLQNKIETLKTSTVSTPQPSSNQQDNAVGCNYAEDSVGQDELSTLLANQSQDQKTNSCLFLGCNGFF